MRVWPMQVYWAYGAITWMFIHLNASFTPFLMR